MDIAALIRRLVLFALAFAIAPAFAVTVTIDGKNYDQVEPIWLPNGDGRYSGATPAEACQNFAGAMDATCRTMTLIGAAECMATCTSGYKKSWAIVKGCPAGYTMNGGGSACLKYLSDAPKCVAGLDIGNSGKVSGAYCVSGCVHEGGITIGASGTKYTMKATGEACTDQEPLPAVPQEVADQCGKGYCVAKGTINGRDVNKCVVCNVIETSNDSTSSTSTTTKDASGNVTGTSSSGTTTTKSTKCEGDSCTTTTTTTTKDEEGKEETTTSSATQTKDSFCSENPRAAACLTGQWGGNCSAGFTCDGDAVQCAVARGTWEQNCRMAPQDGDQSEAIGRAAAAGTLANSDPRAAGGTVSVGSFDQSNPYSSQCPADLSIAVGSYGTLVVPFSKACPYLAFIGWLAVVGSLVGATRFVLA